MEMELVGWQYRTICPEEGPGEWVFTDKQSSADLLKKRSDYQVRRVYAYKEFTE